MAKKKSGGWLNKLYYGDNLEVLREHVPSESVDLVYLDPPFNSNRSYNVLFKEKSGDEAQAQIEAFDDTWTWSHETESLYIELMNGSASNKVKDALEAMRKLLGDNDVLAYLVMMTARLVELHRVLKPTGSIYLHCDPTASHYLKVMLDAIFGPENYRNDIVWKRKAGRGETNKSAIRFGVTNDNILFYAKSKDAPFVRQYRDSNPEYIADKFRYVEEGTGRRYRLDNLASPSYRPNLVYVYKGYQPPAKGWAVSKERMAEMDAAGRLYLPADKSKRIQRKRYLDELEGETVDSLWDDIPPINSMAKERLGYPTQKPLVLLERIILASCPDDGLVLDPFAGCGTAIDAAQKLKKRWMGIDVTTLAIDLIDARLRHTYGEAIRDTYEILGIPRDLQGAQALFKRSPFEFERWCVMTLDGQPNEKQVGDKGVDGVIRIPIDAKGNSEKILVSVKGGATNPGHVRDLVGTVQSQRAAMGVFVCMQKPTKAMTEAANHSGVYTYPVNGVQYPVVQIITVEELIAGKRPTMPATLLPYFQAQRRTEDPGDQSKLF
ncbi:DNA methyltransferase [Microbispora bryophytorum]|uniref:DNA methyltransferase n=1 Tax=Microbispora bryophytorum TaxID=1460882 RepID=UPI00340968E4